MTGESQPDVYDPQEGEMLDILYWDNEYLVRRIERSAGDYTYTSIRFDQHKPSRSDNWEIITQIPERQLSDLAEAMALVADEMIDQ